MKLRRKDKTERLPLSKAEASRLGRWVLVALAIHTVIMLATSMGFIKDTWIDPEGAKLRAEAEKAANNPAAAAGAPAAAPANAGAAAPAPGTTPGALAATAPGDALPEAKVVKESNEAAKPEDIPKNPDDLGISLDETNPN